MTEPTDRQLEILEYMRAYQRKHGMPPTMREIGDEFGIKSTNGVRCALASLKGKGLVEHRPMIARGWIARSPIATGEVR